jgi:hypothetical protein
MVIPIDHQVNKTTDIKTNKTTGELLTCLMKSTKPVVGKVIISKVFISMVIVSMQRCTIKFIRTRIFTLNKTTQAVFLVVCDPSMNEL